MRMTVRQRVVTLLTSCYPTKLTQSQIAARLDLNTNTLRRVMQELEASRLAWGSGVIGPCASNEQIEYSCFNAPSQDAIDSAFAVINGNVVVSQPVETAGGVDEIPAHS